MNSKYNKYIIFALLVIIILLTFGTAFFYNKYQNAAGQVVIWNDSAYVYKNKYNEEYAAKNTYILKAEQLESYNEELYKEYKALKDNPIVITKTEIITRVDTVKTTISDVEIQNDSISWNWNANDSNFYVINGVSGLNTKNMNPYTTINNLTFDTKLTLDVVDNGSQLSVVAKSNNPYVTLSNMQSVVIDPLNSPTIKNMSKPKRWGFGPSVSAGVYAGYDFTSGKVCIGVGGMVGFSIHYDLIQW